MSVIRDAGRGLRERLFSASWMFIIGVVNRIAVSAIAGTLYRHPNNYDLRIAFDGRLTSDRSGFFPLGSYYIYELLFTLCGKHQALLGILLCVIGAVIPLLVVRLTRLVVPTARAATPWIAGWLACLFPPLIFLSSTWRYMLFPVAVGLFHALAVMANPRTPRKWCVGVVVTGVLVLLTRPDYYLGGAFCVLVRRFSWRLRLLSVLVPVTFLVGHNLLMFGPAAPGNLWYNLDAGNNPNTRVATIGYGPERWNPELTLQDLSRDAGRHRRNVREFLFTKPGAFVEGALMKAVRVFDTRRDGALNQAVAENVVYTSCCFAVLVAALVGVGVVSGRTGGRPLWPALLLFIGYALPMIAILSYDRSRVLVQVLWLLFAAEAIVELSRTQWQGIPGGELTDISPMTSTGSQIAATVSV